MVAADDGNSDVVFPAHAGMSPAIVELIHPSGSFPRSRGDEPPEWKEKGAEPEFSPLTRG